MFAQTASLGPIDERQRLDTFWRLEGDKTFDMNRVSFQGEPPASIVPSGGVLYADPMQPYRDVAFTGFRLVEVAGDTIAKVRYITLRELRDSGFELPWEPDEGPVIDDHVPVIGGETDGGPVVSG